MTDEKNGTKEVVRFIEARAMENTGRIVKLEEKHLETLVTLIDVKSMVGRLEDNLAPITKKIDSLEDGSKHTRRAWISFLGQLVTALSAIVAAYIAVKSSGGGL